MEILPWHRIYGVQTSKLPSGSHFDLFYLTLIEDAEKRGTIVPGITPLIEASTGNAGAAFAWAARELGYQATVITHADTPHARVEKLRRLGAEIIFSEAGQYAAGYVKKLDEILRADRLAQGGKLGQNPHRLYCVSKIQSAVQYFPLAEWFVEQIQRSFCEHPDIFVCGVGAGTTLSVLGGALKRRFPLMKIVAVETAEAPVLSALRLGSVVPVDSYHKIPRPPIGMSAAGLPLEKLSINWSIIDCICRVAYHEWRPLQLQCFHKNLPIGRTSAAQLAVVHKLITQQSLRGVYLTLLQDGPSSYDEDEYDDDRPTLK